MGNNTGFNGTFDGQGNAISNMTIADSEYAGLFAYIEEEGTVQNATFKGVELSLQTADSYAGVVAGRNDGTITHCRNASLPPACASCRNATCSRTAP